MSVPEIYNGTHPSGQAVLYFVAYNGGWLVEKSGYLESLTTLASGSLPSGAVAVSYSVGTIAQSGNKPVTSTNEASSHTTLTGSQVLVDLATAAVRGTSSDVSAGAATISVYFYNASGVVVGEATFTFSVGSAGSA